jgi:hypothetical protein
MDVRTDGHRSKPNIVYAHVTPTCNLKCIHCNLPQVDGIEHGTLRRVNEMSTVELEAEPYAPGRVVVAHEKGFDGVMMQILELKHDEVELDYLWPSDFSEMDAVVDRLLEMKAEGYPLLNDTSHIRKFKDYFRAAKHRQASLLERQGACHREESPRQIWEGPSAEAPRGDSDLRS